MAMAHEDAAATPPRVCGKRSWRSAVLQADSDLERLTLPPRARFDSLLGARRQVHQYMSDMLDGRTFGRGDVDVLWASEIMADLTSFLQASPKSAFVSKHEERWPGIGSLYCKCFVRSVDMLSTVRIGQTATARIETVNGALAARARDAGGESILR